MAVSDLLQTSSEKVVISISASSSDPEREHAQKAIRVIRELVSIVGKERLCLTLGGYVGLMRVAADTATEMGVQTIFVIPVEYEHHEFPPGSIIIKTGMSFAGRNVVLVRTGHALLALGGGMGSFMEVVTALEMGKPVALLTGTGSLTDRIESIFQEGLVDERKGGRIVFIEKAEDVRKLINMIVQQMSEY